MLTSSPLTHPATFDRDPEDRVIGPRLEQRASELPSRPRRAAIRSIALSFEPNALFFDEAAGTLLITDDSEDRIVTWSSGRSFSVLARIPRRGRASGRLGQIVRASNGDLLVPRYGYGAEGAVFRVDRAGQARTILSLDPGRRRLGLAVAPDDGRIYETFFEGSDDLRSGGVATLDHECIERDLMFGLKKPVGVVATREHLFVSDQAQNAVFFAPRASPREPRPFALVAAPDALCAAPRGRLFVASKLGTIQLVDADGSARDLVIGLGQPRGVAFDPRGRLFVADRAPAPGLSHFLHVIQLGALDLA